MRLAVTGNIHRGGHLRVSSGEVEMHPAVVKGDLQRQSHRQSGNGIIIEEIGEAVCTVRNSAQDLTGLLGSIIDQVLLPGEEVLDSMLLNQLLDAPSPGAESGE